MTLHQVFSVTHTLSGALCLIAFAYKWGDLKRDPGNLALRALCSARLFNGLAYLMLAPATYVRIGEFTGSANLGTLLGQGLIVLAALSSHIMVLSWFCSPEKARQRLPYVALFYLVALTAMVALFFSASLPGSHPIDFEVHFTNQGASDAYLVVFLVTYGLNLANTALHTWPSSLAIDRPWLSQSLRLSALGSVFVLGFILGKLVGIVGRWSGTTALDSAATLWSPLMASAGSLVLVTGYTLPEWGAAASSWRGRYRSYRTLYPLWFALCRAVPGIALFEPRSPRRSLWLREPETRLYRMVIEIRDGQRVLRPYVCDRCEERLRRELQGRGYGANTDPLMEAYVLSLAMERKKAGLEPSDYTAGSGSRQSGTEFTDELAWLERVAEVYACLPSGRLPSPAPCSCTAPVPSPG
ncbi:MAB_1171c family putative transporter [Streptomyces corynorhini]|uniref:DUF6545 domain-containing protein n=1 Tax=Streptomyces corynorhini TaxID=2282652 RepID=A0A370BDD6_9ACTN|nr:MAB_1171c family putative transporter [Streptomyces corynorhini]RDG39797.1 hypothetical protein DVH02_01795 [Streptomyces corynorhini]